MKLLPKSIVGFLLLSLLLSCGKNSTAYKELLQQHDSLQQSHITVSKEFDEVFSILNEVEVGLNQIRETESQIAQYSERDDILSGEARGKIEESIKSAVELVAGYKAQIAQLQSRNSFNSSALTKKLNSLQKELEQRITTIGKLEAELGIARQELKEKSEKITLLDETISELKGDIESLHTQRELDKKSLAQQEKLLNSGYYFAACRSELIEKGLITKGGLFSPSKISFEADQSLFTEVDIRQLKVINFEAPKAKVLSLHPMGSYKIEVDKSGKASLHILSQNSFWSKTKYLVIRLK